MTLFVAVLSLRLPSKRVDFKAQLAAHLDSAKTQTISSSECMDDIERISALRSTIASKMASKDSYDEAMEIQDTLHEYYGVLQEFETRGIGIGQLQSDSELNLEWESALSSAVESHSTFIWERAGVLWNLVTLEAYQASQKDVSTKSGWGDAAQHFTKAATLLKYLMEIVVVPTDDDDDDAADPVSAFMSPDFSAHFLQLWQGLCMALSQRCVYESRACAPRPRHLLLAKLAAAAVPLLHSCEKQSQKVVSSANGDQDASAMLSVTSNWSDYSRAWGMCVSAQAENHQACIHKDKKEWGSELARLDLAQRFTTLCCEFCESAPLVALQSLHEYVDGKLLPSVKERLNEAEQENSETHHQKIPARGDLAEIRGQNLVTLDQPLDKMIPPLSTPCFTSVLSPHVRRYATLFQMEMNKMVIQMASIAEEKTESARKALAEVHLPHSLTAYRQEQNGGGIPDDLWHRVDAIQRERKLEKLKQDLWGLREVAETARNIYNKVQSQLDFDLESDNLFREQNPGFEGHSATDVQKSFRQSLANYDRLLMTAQEGDSVLLRRSEILETNPKYKLLQFHKSQLDRLLPGALNAQNAPVIDTSRLSRLLVELSSLFHDRDVLLNTFKEEVKNFDIRTPLSEVDSKSPTADQEYRDALTYAQKSFDSLVYEVQTNLNKQIDLVITILEENEQFMRARRRQSSHNSSDSCIVMIEDAIEEIEQFSKHLMEGKSFYDMVIPKLEKFRQQVGDVSARLTVERLEYDDRTNRSRQEERDAMMAQRISENKPGDSNNTGGMNGGIGHMGGGPPGGGMGAMGGGPPGGGMGGMGGGPPGGGMGFGQDPGPHRSDRGSYNSGHGGGGSVSGNSVGSSGGYGSQGGGLNNGYNSQGSGYGGGGSSGYPGGGGGSRGGMSGSGFGGYQPQQPHQSRHQQAPPYQTNPPHEQNMSSGPGYGQQHQQQQQHPPQQQLRQGPKVDDEKVAALVAMEFDPAKVVAALSKHDNNMDQALNELLAG